MVSDDFTGLKNELNGFCMRCYTVGAHQNAVCYSIMGLLLTHISFGPQTDNIKDRVLNLLVRYMHACSTDY